jgi:hypothetical protein
MARNALAALIAVVAVGGTGLAWLEYASSHDRRPGKGNLCFKP